MEDPSDGMTSDVCSSGKITIDATGAAEPHVRPRYIIDSRVRAAPVPRWRRCEDQKCHQEHGSSRHKIQCSLFSQNLCRRRGGEGPRRNNRENYYYITCSIAGTELCLFATILDDNGLPCSIL